MRRSRDFEGNVFYQPLKRPHHRGNPIQDPLVASGALRRGRSRFRLRARDRREFEPVDVREIRRAQPGALGKAGPRLVERENVKGNERSRAATADSVVRT